MDYFSSPFQALIFALPGFLLLYLSFKMRRSHPKNGKRKANTETYGVPEPSRALPIIGHLHLLGGLNQVPLARFLGAMSDKCGPIYSLKVGKHQNLVLSSWKLVKECFSATNDRIFANRPSVAVGKYLFYDNAGFAMSPYGQYWRDIRKIATLHLLSSQRIESLEHVRVSEVNSFVKGLLQLCTNPTHDHQIPLGELLEQLMLNINVRLIAGKRFSASMILHKEETGSGEAHQLSKAIKDATYLAGAFPLSDMISWLEWLDIRGHLRSMKRTLKEIDSILGKWLEEHHEARANHCNNMSRDVSEIDLMDLMLSNIEENDTRLSGYNRDTVIKATAMTLIVTGTEATGLTLIWMFSLLLNNPSVLKAAQEELDAHVGRERWVQESDLTSLKFLQAIFKETLRLYPPGPIIPREASEDCCVVGHHVPKGTRLIVNLWKLHRDPLTWPDPCEFRPERFMTTNSHLNFKGQNFEYIPFSSGRRSCPGYAHSLIVVQLVLARLVQGFNMKTKDDMPVDMSEGLGIALGKLNPLEVVLSPRLPLQLYECL